MSDGILSTAANLLGAYGPWADRTLDGARRELSFLHPRWKRVKPWQKAARRAFQSLLRSPYDEQSQPLEVRLLNRGEHDGLEIEELAWKLPYGPETGAFFLKPAGARGPLPGVLGLHDHAGVKAFGRHKIVRPGERLQPFLEEHRRAYYDGAAWANELARRGYGVLVHDVFPFETRRVRAADLPLDAIRTLMARPDSAETVKYETAAAPAIPADDLPPEAPAERIRAYDALAARLEESLAKSLLCAGRVFPGLVLAEDRWALDVLCGRADIDPGRIGCCGLSGGGLRADYLAGLDERIRCSVTAGFMTTWRDMALRSACLHTWMLYIPFLAESMDFPDILSMHAPLPALVLATEEDRLFDLDEVKKAAATLQEVYRKAGAPEAFRFSLHPGPHHFGRTMQAEAFAWLDRWLS